MYYMYVCAYTHMMTSSNGNFSALLALCAGNSPVTGEFPAQRPVTQSFDVFFDLCLNKRLNKQSWGWWFETPSRLLRRHRNEIYMTYPAYPHTCLHTRSFTQMTHCDWLHLQSENNMRPFLSSGCKHQISQGIHYSVPWRNELTFKTAIFIWQLWISIYLDSEHHRTHRTRAPIG